MATIQFDVIVLAQDQHLRRSIYVAGVTVLCYDHLLSLGSEVAHIWVPRARRTSAWFLLVRYVALLSNLVLAAYFLGDLSAESCKKLSSAEDYLLVIQETFVEVTLALRVCAMYGFNRRVFAALGVAAVITISLGAWAVVGPDIKVESALPGCHVPTSHTAAIHMAFAWEAQLVCDILILGLTLHRTYTYNLVVGPGSRSLLGTMVRDGAAYFAMIGLVNLANILMLYTGDIITAGSLAWFASTISVTMITRLMLNLHDAANGSNWTTPTLNLAAPEVGI
ncbi:hypothetical protein B0H17DRAFT_1330575 [Mycena rosella]|uniref:DUF6533 domain-containing protein n=1 Tax=Mycena rosella TaxID=1033263 RepID=A0AAD7DJX7_MYCRO|nr:hypothetical protein B0H17DRAFT_1330575 [Mycena rosella]